MNPIVIASIFFVYLLGTAFYLLYLTGFNETFGKWARITLTVALLFQLIPIISLLLGLGEPWFHSMPGSTESSHVMPCTFSTFISDMRGIIYLGSLVVTATYLLLSLRYKVDVVGPFLFSVIAVLFCALFITCTGGATHVRVTFLKTITPIHIGSSIVGFLCFLVGFIFSGMYVIQNFQLKEKKLWPIARRLPSLETLNAWIFRCVLIGFPFFTLGIILGSSWVYTRIDDFPIVPQYLFSIATWLIYGALILLKTFANWRGHKLVILSQIGFLMVLSVIMIYMLRV